MTTANIRAKLHEYIDNSDDMLLKLMYAVAKEYNGKSDDYTFSEEDMALFEERRKKRLSGESKLYNWEEAQTIIKGKKTA